MEAVLPSDVAPGQELRLVVLPAQGIPPPEPIPAVVVSAPPGADGLRAAARHGRIAVPPELAATAATAIAEGRITVLIGSTR